MNFRPKTYNTGKVVYWINYASFENSPSKQDGTKKLDGKKKAVQYCLENMLDPKDIIKFDSRTERDYYELLLKRQEMGEIEHLGHHFKLLVQDSFTNANGDLIPQITYEADFIYKDLTDGRRYVVDVKGSPYFIDERFITLKQVFDKIFLDKGLYIKIVLKEGNGWREYHLGEQKKAPSKRVKKQREEIKSLRAEKHKAKIERNKQNREIERLKELVEKQKTIKLTTHERRRLEELQERYKSII